MSDFEVTFYTRHDGDKPAKNFILGLDKKMPTKMLRTIDIQEDKGNQLREPYSKHLDEGIFELRAKVGSDISRVLYIFIVKHEIILSHGFIKKPQKTPPVEIERAKKNRKDYLERMNDK